MRHLFQSLKVGKRRIPFFKKNDLTLNLYFYKYIRRNSGSFFDSVLTIFTSPKSYNFDQNHNFQLYIFFNRRQIISIEWATTPHNFNSSPHLLSSLRKFKGVFQCEIYWCFASDPFLPVYYENCRSSNAKIKGVLLKLEIYLFFSFLYTIRLGGATR